MIHPTNPTITVTLIDLEVADLDAPYLRWKKIIGGGGGVIIIIIIRWKMVGQLEQNQPWFYAPLQHIDPFSVTHIWADTIKYLGV